MTDRSQDDFYNEATCATTDQKILLKKNNQMEVRVCLVADRK